jgi:hypothetical protein
MVLASNPAIETSYGQGKDCSLPVSIPVHSSQWRIMAENVGYRLLPQEMGTIIWITSQIITDHAHLTHWLRQKEVAPRHIQWNEILLRSDFYIPGIAVAFSVSTSQSSAVTSGRLQLRLHA